MTKTSFEKLIFPIGKDYVLPTTYGAPRKLESLAVSGANVVLTATFDKDPDIEVVPCNLMAIKLGGLQTSPYNRIGKINPTVLLTGNCFGEIN